MTSPDHVVPDGSYQGGTVYQYQDVDPAATTATDVLLHSQAENARHSFLGGIVDTVIPGGVGDFLAGVVDMLTGAPASGSTKQRLAGTINGKPFANQIPINSALWQSMSNDEEATFPRAQLSFGAATSTGGGSNSGPRPLNQTPDYQPAGGGANRIEMGFIRISKDGHVNRFGLISGGAQTFLGIAGAFVAVYKMDPDTGDCTLVNPVGAAINVASQITTLNTETTFALDNTISVKQDEVYAVCVHQVTSTLQTCGSLMATTQTALSRPSATLYPRTAYGTVGPISYPPPTIVQAAINWTAGRIPFFYLKRV